MSFVRSIALPLCAIFLVAVLLYSESLTASIKPHPDALSTAGAALFPRAVARPEGGPGRVHVAYWEKWTGFEGDAMRAVVDEFNRSQSRIWVDLLTVSQIDQKVLVAAAGRIPPDVAGLFGPNVPVYADDNAIIPMDDYCRQFGINRSQYIPAFWDIGDYHGHVYALPSTPASVALHWNKGIFRKNAARLRAAGLDPTRPPRTLEELSRYADALTIEGSNGKIVQVGFLPSEPGWWNWSWGQWFGGTLWDGGSRITVDSPENRRGFDWVQSFYRKQGVQALETFRGSFGNFSSPQNAFLSGKVAMELQGVWMYNFIDKYAPGLQWGAAPFPYPADRPDLKNMTIADEDVLCIPRGARHPKEAFEFIRFVQSQKGMELLCMGQRKFTPLLKVSAGFWKNHPNPYVRMFRDLTLGKNVIATPKVGIWAKYQAELDTAFDDVTLNRATAAQALRQVDRRIQPELDEYLETRGLRNEGREVRSERNVP